MIDGDLIKRECLKYDICLTDEQICLMDRFAEFLVFWNKKFNLTAIVSPTDIVYKHFLDSLLITKAVCFENGANFLDVGAGAGFPSIPLAIVNGGLEILQIDGSQKKVNFLNATKNHLNLGSVNAFCGRAENLAKDLKYREKFKYVSARAVARLNMLLEMCLPFVEVGGFFIALKGLQFENELENSKSALKFLGGKVEQIKTFKLSNSNFRAIIVIKKISHTLAIYPRNFSKILKNSL